MKKNVQKEILEDKGLRENEKISLEELKDQEKKEENSNKLDNLDVSDND